MLSHAFGNIELSKGNGHEKVTRGIARRRPPEIESLKAMAGAVRVQARFAAARRHDERFVAGDWHLKGQARQCNYPGLNRRRPMGLTANILRRRRRARLCSRVSPWPPHRAGENKVRSFFGVLLRPNGDRCLVKKS